MFDRSSPTQDCVLFPINTLLAAQEKLTLVSSSTAIVRSPIITVFSMVQTATKQNKVICYSLFNYYVLYTQLDQSGS